eukprot:TRINITY_DN9538_c0_g1_i1.p1 TRINITY_DN9538_c0_g1~~TRINITY_DN9538_c0_g1_i1.p1  ORF type:complete len:207 (+),score=58.85 TRINITY_DN9538_c0_g1_i1:38-658(+)
MNYSNKVLVGNWFNDRKLVSKPRFLETQYNFKPELSTASFSQPLFHSNSQLENENYDELNVSTDVEIEKWGRIQMNEEFPKLCQKAKHRSNNTRRNKYYQYQLKKQPKRKVCMPEKLYKEFEPDYKTTYIEEFFNDSDKLALTPAELRNDMKIIRKPHKTYFYGDDPDKREFGLDYASKKFDRIMVFDDDIYNSFNDIDNETKNKK